MTRKGALLRWTALAAALMVAGGLVTVSCELEEAVEPAPVAAADELPSTEDCARCHRQIHRQWQAGRHAAAASGPLYLAARKTLAGGEPETCHRCHSPNAVALRSNDPTQNARRIAQAVDCHACHVADWTDPKRRNIFRGPYAACATDAHGCAADARLGTGESCRSCHELAGPIFGVAAEPVGLFTTFSELSMARRRGVNCLACHMTAQRGRGAADGPVREAVNRHALDGATNLRALRHAIDARIETLWADEQLEVVLTLTNRGAGHHVPTGLPARRLEVVLTALDADGQLVDSQRWWLGRLLAADASDEPVPFFRATREISDNRLAADQARTFRMFVDRERVRRFAAVVHYHPLAPAIARTLGRPVQTTRVLERKAQVP